MPGFATYARVAGHVEGKFTFPVTAYLRHVTCHLSDSKTHLFTAQRFANFCNPDNHC
jgi:hypothetical protein